MSNRTDNQVTETARQVTEETAKCAVCNGDIPFGHEVPMVPQPDDVKEGFVSVVGASVVLSGMAVVCDVDCLDAWEASE